MEKRWVRVFVVTVLLGVLLVQSIEGQVFEGKTQEMTAEVEPQDTENLGSTESLYDTEDLNNTESGMEMAEETVIETEEVLFYSDYQILDEDLLGTKFVDDAGRELVKGGICEYSEKVKGEFTPVVPEGCSFPEEFVVMMEEIFYHSANARLRYSENNYYEEKLKELGADEFLLDLEDAYALFPKLEDYRARILHRSDAYELISELYMGDIYAGDGIYCDRIFHFHMTKGQDNYLFFYDDGPKSVYPLYLVERVGDKFVLLNEFETLRYGDGSVAQYGEEFYYIHYRYQDNDKWKSIDGLQIHRLNENPREDTLSIHYWPEEYIWEDLRDLYSSADNYNMDTDTLWDIDRYIGNLKEELLYIPETDEGYGSKGHPRYLESGGWDGELELYYGDEKEWESVRKRDFVYYKGDIANCGIPVYVNKVMKYTGAYPPYLNVNFYNNPYRDKLWELSVTGESYFGELVQFWFKNLRGGIYTFRVYHVSDYNYLFHMVRLNENRVRVIQTSVIAPRRKFVVTEGEVFHAGT